MRGIFDDIALAFSRSHAQSHLYPHLKQTRIRAVQQHRSGSDIEEAQDWEIMNHST